MSPAIRPETPADCQAIREVNRLAFGGEDEARLVDALRAERSTPGCRGRPATVIMPHRAEAEMPEVFDRPTVLRLLGELDRRDPRRKLFGSEAHGYKLNPPLPVAVLEEFEERHGVRLPEDYRSFVTEIGNGGAGPYYGLFPFGQHDDGFGLCAWEEGGLVGDPSQPFPHRAAWNLPESFWEGEPDPPPGTSPDEEDRLWQAWDERLEEHYWNPALMNGAIPICHLGCASRQWLVIHGEQKGFVWNDDRADNRGISPLLRESGEPVTFAPWYMTWLEDSLR